jgi:hypothetical protein
MTEDENHRIPIVGKDDSPSVIIIIQNKYEMQQKKICCETTILT